MRSPAEEFAKELRCDRSLNTGVVLKLMIGLWNDAHDLKGLQLSSVLPCR